MPATINPIKKAIVKRELKKGVDAKNAMLKDNYSINTAVKSTANKVVKVSQAEILNELKAADLTDNFIVNGLNDIKKLCITGKKKDLSSAVRIYELWGKYLKMWSDNINTVVLVNTQDNQFSLANRIDKLKGQHKSTDKTNEPIKPEGT